MKFNKTIVELFGMDFPGSLLSILSISCCIYLEETEIWLLHFSSERQQNDEKEENMLVVRFELI